MKKIDDFRTTSPNQILIAPSILAADFSALGDAVRSAEQFGADLLHVDIMDGHFVPNLSLGPAVVRSIRPLTSLFFDVHLMLARPSEFIEPFIESGANHVTIHVEVDEDIRKTLDMIHKRGCSAGISVKPGTDESRLWPYLDEVELILAMTVEPGFGGQSFRHDVIPKIERIRDRIRESNRSIHLEVDGGITQETAAIASRSGANILVAGTSVFRAEHGIQYAIEEMRLACV